MTMATPPTIVSDRVEEEVLLHAPAPASGAR